MAKKKPDIVTDGVFKIETKRLIAPLWIIYTSFASDMEMQDTLEHFRIIVDDYVMKNSGKNMIGLSHTIEKMILITQLLTACAMINNSFDNVKQNK